MKIQNEEGRIRNLKWGISQNIVLCTYGKPLTDLDVKLNPKIWGLQLPLRRWLKGIQHEDKE